LWYDAVKQRDKYNCRLQIASLTIVLCYCPLRSGSWHRWIFGRDPGCAGGHEEVWTGPGSGVQLYGHHLVSLWRWLVLRWAWQI